MNKKKILFITTNFPPSTSIGTERIKKICKYLDGNWKVYILTLKEKYYPEKINKHVPLATWEKELSVYRTSKFDILSALIKIKEAVSGKSNGNAARLPSKKKPGVAGAVSKKTNIIRMILGRMTDWLEFPDKDVVWIPFALITGLVLIKKKNIEVIYSSSPRHSNHITAALLKLITGKKLVIEFRDPWARSPWHDDERVSSPLERFKHKLIIMFENFVVKVANRVILVTEAMRDDYVKYYYNIDDSKFTLIYNGYDPDNLCQIKDNGINSNQVVFSHIGSLYKRRNPKNVLKAIFELKKEGKIDATTCVFNFIGIITDELLYLKQYIKDMQINDLVYFLPKISYQDSIRCMQNSDVLVLLQPLTKIQLPAKFYDYICFSKPIFAIAEKNSEVEKVIGNNFGKFSDNNDIDSIKKGIVELMDNSGFNAAIYKENREKYSIANFIKNFERTISIC